MKHLDKIANLAIILAVIVFLTLAFRGDLALHGPSQKNWHPPSENLVGTKVSVRGLELPKDRDSLLLVVSTECHYCQESLPFYKELTAKAHGHVNIVAVLPQPGSEAQRFLRDADVQADQVVTATPDKLGVRGTPTVMLVDPTGTVKHEWLGRLDANGQKNLLDVSLSNKSS